MPITPFNKLRGRAPSFVSAVALITTSLTLLMLGSPANAAPGTPGQPSPGITVLYENFQNVSGPSPVIKLNAYTGAGGETYTADPAWLTNCNGWLTSTQQSVTAEGPLSDAECGDQTSWNHTQQMAAALGMHAGLSEAESGNNYAVSAYTQADPGPDGITIETAHNLPFVSSNRYVMTSVDIAAMNCGDSSAPTIQFDALDSTQNSIPVGGVINGCSSTTDVTVGSVGNAAAIDVRVGTYNSDSAVLIHGPSVGVKLINTNPSGEGNDYSFDNVRIVDVTPQLDKSFSPTTILAGQKSTLTLTMTNTIDLAAKNGWSFTDALPSGVTVAGVASTTCPDSSVVAAQGSGSVAVTSGNLAQGMISCAITVPVTASKVGSYVNSASNITGIGVNPPGTATLVVNPALAETGLNVIPTVMVAGGIIASGIVALVIVRARRRRA